MNRSLPGCVMTMLVLLFAAPALAAHGTDAALAGTVRDRQGTPQMGALLELLSPDATTVASTLSDDHGRYILPSVLPGQYHLRVTAAFFMPAIRTNLRLTAGTQAIVNITMNTIFDAASWLPAQRRRADEPNDDWKWALRSTANRPLLRLLDSTGDSVSSSAEQRTPAISEGRYSILSGDGTFGGSGTHQALQLVRTMEDGEAAMLSTEIGLPDAGQITPVPAPSVSVTAGYERRTGFGGSTRLVSSYQSHPEIISSAQLDQGIGQIASQPGGQGFQVMQLASTEQMALGDIVLIDAGTLMEAEHLVATRLLSEPYLRITTHPNSEFVVEYRLATGRTLQSAEDLDRLRPAMAVGADGQGRPLGDKGFHQELSVSRRISGQTVVTGSVFEDRFAYGDVSGGGMNATGQVGSAAIVDPATGIFHLATTGYGGPGMSLSAMQPLTPTLSVWAGWDMGTALSAQASHLGLAEAIANAHSTVSQAASVALRGRLLQTGTSLKVEYRWQPVHTLTQVNAYNATPEEVYLSLLLRQRLWTGRFLPKGVDAVFEATNLLEQGYQPVLAPDGHTLFLAQVPRSIQGGVAFNF